MPSTLPYNVSQGSVNVDQYVRDHADSSALRDNGVETFSRRLVTSSITGTSQLLVLSYFTARKMFTCANVTAYTTGTAAAATPTICRYGIYTATGNGALTLAASTTNDTTLFAATNTAYLKALTTAYQIVPHARYAVGILVVTGAAAPTFAATTASVGPTSINGDAPRLYATFAAQADLPATVAVGSLTDVVNGPYAVLQP